MINTTKDKILNELITIIQPKDGYRASIDPIILASCIQNNPNNIKVLDIGCGVGTIALILANNNSNNEIHGIDIQKDLIEMAHQNIELNELDNVSFINNNIIEYSLEKENEYNIVVTNPPYMDVNKYSKSKSNIKNIANSEENIDLNEWIKSAHRVLKSSGSIYMIHRADRLDDILRLMHNKFGNIIICPLFPKNNKPANRVIIYARKNKKDPLKILKGIILHEEDGTYTNQMKDILYNNKKFNLTGN